MIRVIVVDDNIYLNSILCDHIDGLPDMKVTANAADPQEACARADDTPCDVMLMDIEMGTPIAGIEAAEKIHKAHPEIKIIYLTAHESADLIIAGMGRGAVDYIVKSRGIDTLADRIRKAANGEVSLDSKVQKILLDEFARLQHSEHSLLFFMQRYSALTPAERELIRFLLKDMTVREIARERCVSELTIKSQVKGLLKKFGCSRSRQIVEQIREYDVEYLFV